MKKSFYFVALFLLVAVVGYSQIPKESKGWYEPDTINTFLEDNTPYDRMIYTYDELGMKTSEMHLSWNSENSCFENITYRRFFYNVEKRVEKMIEQDWDKNSNQWINFLQEEFEYDEKGNLASEHNSIWDTENNVFVKNRRMMYTYDEYNNKIKISYQSWDKSAQEWEEKHYYNYLYVYDDKHLILSQTMTGSFGSDSSKYEYTYDKNGYKISEKFGHTDCAGIWSNYDSITYTYDVQYNLIRRESKIWSDDSAAYIHASWDGRITYAYDENNNRISHVRETYNYDLSAWEVDDWNSKLEWTYENDNAVVIRSYAWNKDSLLWQPATSGHVDIHYNNMHSGFEGMLSGHEFRISYQRFELLNVCDRKNMLELKIYPNPSVNHVYIDGIMENSSLSIYDYTGKLLRRTAVNTSTKWIDITSLENGMYLFVISNSSQKTTRKIVKQSR